MKVSGKFDVNLNPLDFYAQGKMASILEECRLIKFFMVNSMQAAKAKC